MWPAQLAGMLAVTLLIAAGPSSRPAPAKSDKTGAYQTTFVEPHDIASQREAQKRFRWREKPQPFNLADEAFQVVVPESYQPDGTYGVFVWVSPTPSGRLPPMWAKSLDRLKLIWIAADHSENERHIDHRCRMAVEAALHARELYEIDKHRVYIGGFSGGGKVAAMTAANYAEVFTGVVSMCGPLFYRNIPTGLKPDEFYPQGYYPMPPKVMQQFRNATRHVLLTGEKDFNLQPTKQTYEFGYVKDKFKQVELFVVPDLAHELPSSEWFERTIQSLDRPLAGTTKPSR